MHRSAISRIEVVVLVCVAMFGAGLVVLFIARQRENGLRLQCADNLRRQGIAIQGFSTQSGAVPFLPPARIADGYATWGVLLAPHFVAGNPLNDWDVSRSYFAQPAKVREAIVPYYFCPARARPSALSIAGDIDPATGVQTPGAVGDYAGVAGTGDSAHPWDGPDADGAIILGEVLERKDDRILRWRGRTSLEAIRKARGLSQTLLIGEKHVPVQEENRAAVGDGSLYNGSNPASCARVAGPGFGLAPDVTAPFNTNFGSPHSGICNFLYADGSARPLADGINETILGELARRDKQR